MAGSRDYDATKFGELIVYAAEKSAGDARFGKTKLNKILFFTDFIAYQTRGRSVSGAVYQHLPMGPCPHQLLPVLNSLQYDGSVTVEGQQTFGGLQHRVVATREPDLSSFDEGEIGIVDYVLQALRPLTNAEVSDLSHRTRAWQLTDEHQEIPYGSALISSDGPTEEDLVWLREVMSDAGMDTA